MTRRQPLQGLDIFRDILADIFSTPGAYSVMLSTGTSDETSRGRRTSSARQDVRGV